MQPAIKAFEACKEESSSIYSFEQPKVEFEPAQEGQFKKNNAAWKFFQSQHPGIKKPPLGGCCPPSEMTRKQSV
jgi:hypothetical protein